jgi:hypothetical protein
MTDKKKVSKFKFFWADQVAEQEQWLGEMARQGLHLEKVNVLCVWTFVRGEPADVVYQVDFNSHESADYVQLLEDAGWTRVTSLTGWQFWRTAAGNGRSPELFTDLRSKKLKYQRLVALIMLCLFPGAILLTSESTRVAVAGLSWPFLGALIVLYGMNIIGLLRLLVRLASMRSEPA